MKVEQFFGLHLDQDIYSTDALTDLVGLTRQIGSSKTVKRLTADNSKSHPIFDIAKRQLVLKQLRPLLEDSLLKYDSHWYTKDVNYSTESDRKYGAEDKLLEFCLCIASGNSLKHMINIEYRPNAQTMREAPHEERFSRYWELLASETRDAVERYQEEARKRSEEENSKAGGFFSKIFNK